MSPFQALLQSRKFWLLVLDVVISTVLLVVAQFAPQVEKVVVEVIAIYQPVFVFLIVSIAVEDAALKRSGNFPAG